MRKSASELEWSKAQEIVLGVNLVKAAEEQLRFLAAIDSIQCLYDGHILNHAIYRYNYCWLPLLAKHVEFPVIPEPIVVPLDCEWIWHCHRLNPVQYKVDCMEIYGKILDNCNVISTLTGTCTKPTESIWKLMYPTEPYHLEVKYPSPTKLLDHGSAPKSTKYDLIGAVKRQSSFFMKVPKSIIDDKCFLENAVARYKAFLHLIKREEKTSINFFCVPTYDIDLMWHSHQLYPASYREDLTTIFGRILDHNDRDTDDMKIEVGFEKTKKLWEETFGQQYEALGSMDSSRCVHCACGVAE